MRSTQLIILVTVFLPSCTADPTLPSHTEFQIGASRAEVRREFGTPDRIASLHKRDDSIWGAIESFWDTVPTGSTVEVWSYRSENPGMGEGQTELYFIDNSKTVDGIGFSPEGVVYESSDGA